MRAVFVLALVALLAVFGSALASASASADESLQSSMAAWPESEVMPLLAEPADLANMDLPEDDHALVEADAETEAEAEADADADADAELDAEAEAEAEAEVDAEAEAEAQVDAEVQAEFGVSALSSQQLQELMAGELELSDEQKATLMAEVTSAVASQVRADNCGSGWNSRLVPDYNMSGACATHDRCYGRCNSGKANCDNRFLADMKAICKRKYPSGGLAVKLRLCNTQANVYYTAVAKMGAKPYANGQKKACKKF